MKKPLFFAGLWLMVWGSYNTDFGAFIAPFPHNLINGIRSLLPLLAMVLAVIFLIKKKYPLQRCLLTPLGFLGLYTVMGIVASVFSPQPVSALYWGFLYGSPIVVLLAVLASAHPLSNIALVMKISWVIAGGVALMLMVYFFVHSGVLPNSVLLVCGSRPFEGLGSIAAQTQFFAMAGPRPTGLGRYAGLAALVCFFGFCFTKERRRFVWFALFLVFLTILIFSRGRTEVVAFVFAIPAALFFGRKYKYFFMFILSLLVFWVGFNIFYQNMCPPPSAVMVKQEAKPSIIPATTPLESKPPTFVVLPSPQSDTSKEPQANPIGFFVKNSNLKTLSGRTNGVWSDALQLFLSKPLTGYGFQADRYLLGGQHAHNTLLHAVVQAGVLGTTLFVLAFLYLLLMFLKLIGHPGVSDNQKSSLIIAFAVVTFFVVRGITESLAFFSADWLFIVPVIAYVTMLYQIAQEYVAPKHQLMRILGNTIDMVQIPDVIEQMDAWIAEGSVKPHWIVATGMHGVMEAQKNTEFKKILATADMWAADGISLVWMARLNGFHLKKRVAGPDLFHAFLQHSIAKGYKNYFYGDTDETLAALHKKLPNVKTESFSPPFRKLTPEEDTKIIQDINNAKPQVLWIGLGLPKQEKWIFEHKDKLQVPVIIGVGAAFKFEAGTTKRAPKWMGDNGLEWLHRLFQEPKRVWRRVFIDMPQFMWFAGAEFIKNKIHGK